MCYDVVYWLLDLTFRAIDNIATHAQRNKTAVVLFLAVTLSLVAYTDGISPRPDT